MEMDGIGLELVYGQQSGNAGQAGTTGTDSMNDLDETLQRAETHKVKYFFAPASKESEIENLHE